MGRKLGFSYLPPLLGHYCSSFSSSSSSSYLSSWPWSSCKNIPRTHSFRKDRDDDDDEEDYATGAGHDVFKTANSVYLNWVDIAGDEDDDAAPPPYSDGDSVAESTEEHAAIIRELPRSGGRLFFEPGASTSSIMAAPTMRVAFEETSVAMSVESEDPYKDFRSSMEEMVAAHGVTEWEQLEELLVVYLRLNGKKTHGLILGAFVDLLVGLASSSSSSSSSSAASSASSSSSSTSTSRAVDSDSNISSSNCLFLCSEIEEIVDVDDQALI